MEQPNPLPIVVEIELQETATSSEWPQFSTPNPLCWHVDSITSDEVH